MKKPKNEAFTDRRVAAAEAKAALLQNYRIAKEAAEPTRLVRQEERLAIAEAREGRRAEREQARRAEQERLQAEAAARQAEAATRQAAADAAAAADAEARAAAEKSRIHRVIEDEAARKAARDKRYADRKARQR